ncbi:MAG: DUF1330 domain-containing protein [Gammaproteobacteria bacterium]|nr:DUF1330 domain-containing protein [Gammaproteobacteria bacterium]
MRRLVVSVACALLAACQGSAVPVSDVASEQSASAEACAVYMIISGETLDRRRMAAYSEALLASGLYPTVGGRYVNQARPFSVIEGTPPADYVTLVVRFPDEHALTEFWYSQTYQQEILPLRIDPPAANFTVTAHRSHEFDADTSRCD